MHLPVGGAHLQLSVRQYPSPQCVSLESFTMISWIQNVIRTHPSFTVLLLNLLPERWSSKDGGSLQNRWPLFWRQILCLTSRWSDCFFLRGCNGILDTHTHTYLQPPSLVTQHMLSICWQCIVTDKPGVYISQSKCSVCGCAKWQQGGVVSQPTVFGYEPTTPGKILGHTARLWAHTNKRDKFLFS